MAVYLSLEFNYPLHKYLLYVEEAEKLADCVLSSASSLCPTRWELNNDTRFTHMYSCLNHLCCRTHGKLTEGIKSYFLKQNWWNKIL